jgi:hypothetical protein
LPPLRQSEEGTEIFHVREDERVVAEKVAGTDINLLSKES